VTCEYCQLLYLLTAISSGPEISRWAEDLDGTISIDPVLMLLNTWLRLEGAER